MLPQFPFLLLLVLGVPITVRSFLASYCESSFFIHVLVHHGYQSLGAQRQSFLLDVLIV